jgi:hypothetical protein
MSEPESPRITFACPRCALACAETGEPQPHVGDLSLCIHCGAPLELGEGEPRWLTYDEVKRLPEEARKQLILTLVAIVTARPALTQRDTWRPKPEGPR